MPSPIHDTTPILNRELVEDITPLIGDTVDAVTSAHPGVMTQAPFTLFQAFLDDISGQIQAIIDTHARERALLPHDEVPSVDDHERGWGPVREHLDTAITHIHEAHILARASETTFEAVSLLHMAEAAVQRAIEYVPGR
jgi:hypothetical protein